MKVRLEHGMNQGADREGKGKQLTDRLQLLEMGSVVRADIGQRDNVRR